MLERALVLKESIAQFCEAYPDLKYNDDILTDEE